MPKRKTNRSAAKRFRVTASGKIKHRRCNRSHLLTKKSRKRKRHLRRPAYLKGGDARQVGRLLNL